VRLLDTSVEVRLLGTSVEVRLFDTSAEVRLSERQAVAPGVGGAGGADVAMVRRFEWRVIELSVSNFISLAALETHSYSLLPAAHSDHLRLAKGHNAEISRRNRQ
jgi:hypothetical protein